MKGSTAYAIGTALPILLLLAGLAVYYLVRAAKRTRYTGRTMGVVTETEYQSGVHGGSYYVRFRYTADGETYTGRTSISSLQVKRFEPGRTSIPVQYDVRQPEKYLVPDPYYL